MPDRSFASSTAPTATSQASSSGSSPLNPGRYVGTDVDDLDDEVFEEKLAAAHTELHPSSAVDGHLRAVFGLDRP